MSNSTLRIIATTDVHGKVLPIDYATNKFKPYGLLLLSCAINRLRTENTILIDNGDALEGSPLQLYYLSKHSEGCSPATRMMKEMGYDFFNPGNHDFDFGKKEVYNHSLVGGMELLRGNITDSQGGSDAIKHIEVGGKNIMIVGLTTPFVSRWESEDKIYGMEFNDAFRSLKTILDSVSEGDIDYVVVVYHGGFERDPETGEKICQDNGENQGYRILNELAGINVLITGHQHMVMSGVTEKGTAYVQGGQDGVWISYIDLDLETGEATPHVIKCEDMEGLIEECKNAPVPKEVLEEHEACQAWLDEPIGRITEDLRVESFDEYIKEHPSATKEEYEVAIRIEKPQVVTLMNRIIMEITGAEISATALFPNATGVGGEITRREILSTYSFSNTLCLKKINGAHLKTYLERIMEFWAVSRGEPTINPDYLIPVPQLFNYEYLDGIEYRGKISNPVGERIVSLTHKGHPICDNDEFIIAVNSFRGTGAGGFDMIAECPTVSENMKSVADILTEYIIEKGEIEFSPEKNVMIEV